MVAQNLGSDRLCNRLLGRALPGLLLARSQPGKRFGDVHHLIILLGSPVVLFLVLRATRGGGRARAQG